MTQVESGPGEPVLADADRDAAVAAVKARLNLTIAEDDALIAAFAESAMGLAEQFTGRVLIARAMVARVAASGGWVPLPAGSVREITALADAAGMALAAGSYAIDIDAGGRGWLRVPAGGVVTVTFTAGEADSWAAVPASIREGACVLAAHLYRDRDGRAPIPVAVTALWRPFRVTRLTEARRA